MTVKRKYLPVKRLNDIAVSVMQELISAKKETFILLKNEEVRKWWELEIETREAEANEKRRLEKEEELKKSALSKLTPEEKKFLNIKG